MIVFKHNHFTQIDLVKHKIHLITIVGPFSTESLNFVFPGSHVWEMVAVQQQWRQIDMSTSPWLCKHFKWRTTSSHTMLCFPQTFMFLLQHFEALCLPSWNHSEFAKGLCNVVKIGGTIQKFKYNLSSLDWMIYIYIYIHLFYYFISEPQKSGSTNLPTLNNSMVKI